MNSRNFLAIATLLVTCTGCASERLCVKVVDDEGLPVSNATVNVYFTSSHIVFGEGTDHHYEAKTDTNGNAVVKFNCSTSDFAWRVEADCIPRWRGGALSDAPGRFADVGVPCRLEHGAPCRTRRKHSLRRTVPRHGHQPWHHAPTEVKSTNVTGIEKYKQLRFSCGDENDMSDGKGREAVERRRIASWAGSLGKTASCSAETSNRSLTGAARTHENLV